MTEYVPVIRENPKTVVESSAWMDIPTILKDIIVRFKLETVWALEFGVDKGYSTSALANYFKEVIGVDNQAAELMSMVADSMKDFPNVELINSSYEEFIEQMDKSIFTMRPFDLIHIDLNHGFDEVVRCGSWALAHSRCVIIHDTISYPETMRACVTLAIMFDIEFYNYPASNGLAILIRK